MFLKINKIPFSQTRERGAEVRQRLSALAWGITLFIISMQILLLHDIIKERWSTL